MCCVPCAVCCGCQGGPGQALSGSGSAAGDLHKELRTLLDGVARYTTLSRPYLGPYLGPYLSPYLTLAGRRGQVLYGPFAPL